jgi:hypothetical protein
MGQSPNYEGAFLFYNLTISSLSNHGIAICLYVQYINIFDKYIFNLHFAICATSVGVFSSSLHYKCALHISAKLAILKFTFCAYDLFVVPIVLLQFPLFFLMLNNKKMRYTFRTHERITRREE